MASKEDFLRAQYARIRYGYALCPGGAEKPSFPPSSFLPGSDKFPHSRRRLSPPFIPSLSQAGSIPSRTRARLNAVTGWCGQAEAFTYVAVDLGLVHRVKAILVKGVITDDVTGRPTELRFFYKEQVSSLACKKPSHSIDAIAFQESDNYVVYFPNFNLTARDPGKPGRASWKLRQITPYLLMGVKSATKSVVFVASK